MGKLRFSIRTLYENATYTSMSTRGLANVMCHPVNDWPLCKRPLIKRFITRHRACLHHRFRVATTESFRVFSWVGPFLISEWSEWGVLVMISLGRMPQGQGALQSGILSILPTFNGRKLLIICKLILIETILKFGTVQNVFLLFPGALTGDPWGPNIMAVKGNFWQRRQLDNERSTRKRIQPISASVVIFQINTKI